MSKPLHLFVDPSHWTLVHNYGRDRAQVNVVHNNVALAPVGPYIPAVSAAAAGLLSARPPYLPTLPPYMPLNVAPLVETDTSVVALYLHLSDNLLVTNPPFRQRMESIEVPPHSIRPLKALRIWA